MFFGDRQRPCDPDERIVGQRVVEPGEPAAGGREVTLDRGQGRAVKVQAGG